ncbi:TPA: hypothetical protein ACOQ31_001702 [Bacillus cereus]|uniref:hypothetical protein n=1 Tax=Bacillus cereus group TaxID=86661 RepID=UPI000507FB9A|nr:MULTISPECIES: hypothetical protein [Bacillus cereus group]MRA63940.1 hypothetical protein [Bacillus thuringiensis]OUB96626.1 hypothetical protein BK752_16260 [Bacillus thuringiensis serovar canadensis]KFL86147.1 hypothetical protein DJ51_5106 [Bacillus cereus]KXI78508.1 hypothetical protein ACS52_11780 [Bacillus cereus]MBE5113813.1 hypothetical protein [Bacillus paranthracis]
MRDIFIDGKDSYGDFYNFTNEHNLMGIEFEHNYLEFDTIGEFEEFIKIASQALELLKEENQ